MNNTYIWAEIFTIVAYLCLALSYLAKRRRYIVLWSVGMVVLNGIAFALLQAWTGLVMCGVALVRNIYIMWDVERHGKARKWRLKDFLSLIIFMTLIIVATIPTYTEPLSAMSALATVCYTLSLWQKKTVYYKLLGIPSSAAELTYHVFIWNLAGIVLEGVVLTVSVIGFVLDVRRHQKNKKLSKQSKKGKRYGR